MERKLLSVHHRLGRLGNCFLVLNVPAFSLQRQNCELHTLILRRGRPRQASVLIQKWRSGTKVDEVSSSRSCVTRKIWISCNPPQHQALSKDRLEIWREEVASALSEYETILSGKLPLVQRFVTSISGNRALIIYALRYSRTTSNISGRILHFQTLILAPLT